MPKPFDIDKEFPNFFKQVKDSLIKAIQIRKISERDGSSEQTEDKAFARVENLLSANMQALMNRLNLIYVDSNGKPALDYFFRELKQRMIDVLPQDVPKENLEVYISGGVVRALLAYIYKDMHLNIQHSHQSSKAKQISYNSQYLNIRNYLLKNLSLTNFKLVDFNKIYNELSIVEQSEKELVENLANHLISNQKKFSVDKLDIGTDKEIYDKFIELKNKNDSSEYSESWSYIEYYLVRKYLLEKTPLSQSSVLGVGSDLDILYELKGSNDDKLKNKLREVAESFINEARIYFNLREDKSPLLNSLVPIGDVNEYNEHTSSVVSQGGSMLDTLAFSINIENKATNQSVFFIEPTSDNKPMYIMKGFIEGVYDYIKGSQETQKQTVRGLRALLEIPFLQLSEQGARIILEELHKIEKQLQSGTLDSNAMMQVQKMIRNANFSGANNRAFRESSDKPLSFFLNILNKMTSNDAGRIGKVFPKFLESFNTKELSGKYLHDIDGILLSKENFVEKHTKSGVLYHGTSRESILPIMRAGFFISDETQGTAVFGSGLYTTPDFNLANGYAGTDGFVLELNVNFSNNLRVINIKDISPDILEKLQEEAKEHNIALNQLLRESYGIDILIDGPVIVQNMDAIIRPENIMDIIRFVPDIIKNSDVTLYEKKQLWENYNGIYNMIKFMDNSGRQLVSPLECLEGILAKLKFSELSFMFETSLIHDMLKIYYKEITDASKIHPNIISLTKESYDNFSDVDIFSILSPELKNDENFILLLLKNQRELFYKLPTEMQNNEKFVLSVLKQDVDAFQCIPDRLYKSEQVALCVVNQKPIFLKIFPDEIKNNEKVVLAAIRDNIRALKFASSDLNENKDFLLKVMIIKEWPDVKDYIKEDVYNNIINEYGDNKIELKNKYFSEILKDFLEPKQATSSYLLNSANHKLDILNKKITGVENLFFDYISTLENEKEEVIRVLNESDYTDNFREYIDKLSQVSSDQEKINIDRAKKSSK